MAIYSGRPMVIILNNNSVHINQQVIDTIQGVSHLIYFLPPYLPDFNPIKLTFLVLKSWIKRYYYFL
jgi:transposase